MGLEESYKRQELLGYSVQEEFELDLEEISWIERVS